MIKKHGRIVHRSSKKKNKKSYFLIQKILISVKYMFWQIFKEIEDYTFLEMINHFSPFNFTLYLICDEEKQIVVQEFYLCWLLGST